MLSNDRFETRKMKVSLIDIINRTHKIARKKVWYRWHRLTQGRNKIIVPIYRLNPFELYLVRDTWHEMLRWCNEEIEITSQKEKRYE